MSFHACLLITTYVMTAAGLAALMLVESVGGGFVAAVAAACLASLPVNLRRRPPLPGALWNVLALVLFAVFVSFHYALSASLIDTLARFLAVLMAAKLFDMSAARDYVLLFVLVLFLILSAAASTVSPAFLALLALFVIGAIWAMILLNLRRDWEESARRPDAEPPPGLLGPSFFLYTAALTCACLVMTMGLFFILPRMAAGFFQTRTLDTVKISGFSDSVELGAMGPVKLDDTVVMRVEFPGLGSPPAPLYLRGRALDTFDGRQWSEALEQRRLVRGGNGRFRLAGAAQGALLAQRIVLEPLETETLFAAGRAVVVEGRFKNLWVDSKGAVRLPSPPFSRTEYRVWSRPVNGDGSALARNERRLYLELPRRLSPRVAGLARTVTADASGDLEAASAIRRHLTENYRYTLDPAPGPTGDPVGDFLFHTREGYCEHYATAMAVMLRTVGIPSRLVTGFLQGRWNEYGDYLVVRNSDAHTWVEAYIEGAGWMRFDPTPGQAPAPDSGVSTLALLMDSLRWRWIKYVVTYSSADQLRAAAGLERRAGSMLGSLRTWLKGLGARAWGAGEGAGGGFPVTAALSTAAVAAAALFALRRHGRPAGAGGDTPAYYREMLRVLEKKGFPRRPSETPSELAARCGSAHVRAVTEVFEAHRYGGVEPPARVMAEVRRRIKGLSASPLSSGKRQGGRRDGGS